MGNTGERPLLRTPQRLIRSLCLSSETVTVCDGPLNVRQKGTPKSWRWGWRCVGSALCILSQLRKKEWSQQVPCWGSHCPRRVACSFPCAAGRGQATARSCARVRTRRDAPRGDSGRSPSDCPLLLQAVRCALLPGGTEGFLDFPNSECACDHSLSRCPRVPPGGRLHTTAAGGLGGVAACRQPALEKHLPPGSHFCQRLWGPHVRPPGSLVRWSTEWETVSHFSWACSASEMELLLFIGHLHLFLFVK